MPVFKPNDVHAAHDQTGGLQAGRWALAVKTLEDMEASGLRPNEHNWLTAIGA